MQAIKSDFFWEDLAFFSPWQSSYSLIVTLHITHLYLAKYSHSSQWMSVVFFYKGFTHTFLGLFFYLMGVSYHTILLLQFHFIVLEVYVLSLYHFWGNTGHLMLVCTQIWVFLDDLWCSYKLWFTLASVSINLCICTVCFSSHCVILSRHYLNQFCTMPTYTRMETVQFLRVA